MNSVPAPSLPDLAASSETGATRPEFGHFGYIGKGVCLDVWGAGPFVIAVDGKTYRFEDSDRFGPLTIRPDGRETAKQPGERSPFWRAHGLWVWQGRRLEADGFSCIWAEPKPTVLRILPGKLMETVDLGEPNLPPWLERIVWIDSRVAQSTAGNASADAVTERQDNLPNHPSRPETQAPSGKRGG